MIEAVNGMMERSAKADLRWTYALKRMITAERRHGAAPTAANTADMDRERDIENAFADAGLAYATQLRVVRMIADLDVTGPDAQERLVQIRVVFDRLQKFTRLAADIRQDVVATYGADAMVSTAEPGE